MLKGRQARVLAKQSGGGTVKNQDGRGWGPGGLQGLSPALCPFVEPQSVWVMGPDLAGDSARVLGCQAIPRKPGRRGDSNSLEGRLCFSSLLTGLTFIGKC